jgi:hypothetical protein
MIVLSWFDVVSTTIGWSGFRIGVAKLRPPPSGSQPEPPQQKQKL